MRSMALILLALADVGAAQAAGTRVTAKQLVDGARNYVGKKIVVSNIGCVNDPKAHFLCVAVVGGQGLRIEALALGVATERDVAERTIGDCRGTANLTQPACRFDAEFEVQAAHREEVDTPSGSMPATIVYAVGIDLASPRRR